MFLSPPTALRVQVVITYRCENNTTLHEAARCITLNRPLRPNSLRPWELRVHVFTHFPFFTSLKAKREFHSLLKHATKLFSVRADIGLENRKRKQIFPWISSEGGDRVCTTPASNSGRPGGKPQPTELPPQGSSWSSSVFLKICRAIWRRPLKTFGVLYSLIIPTFDSTQPQFLIATLRKVYE